MRARNSHDPFSQAKYALTSVLLREHHILCDLRLTLSIPNIRKTILCYTHYNAFTVVAVDDSICRMAARSNKPVFEDGIVRACAERMRVDFIISRDEKAFLHSPIKRLSARDYVDLFCDVKQAAF